jgi:hypothetical protein
MVKLLEDVWLADTTGLAQDIVVSCPPPDAKGLAEAIRSRGNCPLDINGSMLAELSAKDVSESWSSACKLSERQISTLTHDLGCRLADAEQGAALDAKLGEAAAFFLLALRQSHITPEDAMQGCRVIWHPLTEDHQVECLVL